MSLVKKTKEQDEPVVAGEGLDDLLKRIIKDNPAAALEILAKLRTNEPSPEPQTHIQQRPDPNINKEFRNFGKVGEKPRAVKITVLEVQGESRWVSLQCGVKPKVNLLRGIPWIVPMEYLSVLDDASADTFIHIPLMQPDPKTGNTFERQDTRIVRCPYTLHGEVPWEEYEAFRAKLNQDGGKL